MERRVSSALASLSGSLDSLSSGGDPEVEQSLKRKRQESLLESIVKRVGSPDKKSEVGGVATHSKTARAWNYADFLLRLRSFDQTLDWFAKPACISPLECCRVGFVCTARDTLTCTMCGAVVVHDDRTDPFGTALQALLLSKHVTPCPWPHTPCPASFCTFAPVHPTDLLAAVGARMDALLNAASAGGTTVMVANPAKLVNSGSSSSNSSSGSSSSSSSCSRTSDSGGSHSSLSSLPAILRLSPLPPRLVNAIASKIVCWKGPSHAALGLSPGQAGAGADTVTLLGVLVGMARRFGSNAASSSSSSDNGESFGESVTAAALLAAYGWTASDPSLSRASADTVAPAAGSGVGSGSGSGSCSGSGASDGGRRQLVLSCDLCGRNVEVPQVDVDQVLRLETRLPAALSSAVSSGAGSGGVSGAGGMNPASQHRSYCPWVHGGDGAGWAQGWGVLGGLGGEGLGGEGTGSGGAVGDCADEGNAEGGCEAKVLYDKIRAALQG